MSAPWLHICVGLGCYLLGSFPTGVVLSKRKYRIDVREMGSGNIGATNVTRVFGWYAGILTLGIDFVKGFVPVYFLQKYFPSSPWLLTIGGMSLVFGHCFSLYLGFRGGKGVATSFGCIAVLLPQLALISGATYCLLLILTKISAIGSLGGVAVTLGYLVWFRPPAFLTCLLLGICVIVLIRHSKNIRRLATSL